MPRRTLCLLSLWLLLLLPFAAPAHGQALRRGSDKLWKVFTRGGYYRPHGSRWYLALDNGVGDLMVMNYVDGYSLGPHTTVGRYLGRGKKTRLEVETTLRYALSRHTWLGQGALRYLSKVERGRSIEIYGGREAVDYDPQPRMPLSQSLLATGLFGWDDYKLLDRTTAGLRFDLPVVNDVSLCGNVRYERRLPLENTRHENVFGVKAGENVPLRRVPYSATEKQPYQGEVEAELALLTLRLTYHPHRRRLVLDEMTAYNHSHYPLFTAEATGGLGTDHFLSYAFSVQQALDLPRYADDLRYHVGIGNSYSHGRLGLADYHHFPASTFWWQRTDPVRHFTHLTNYELSTANLWSEAHAEWSTTRFFLTRLLPRRQRFLREYLQVHAAFAEEYPLHTEYTYGLDVLHLIRLSVSAALDGTHSRGLAFQLTLLPESLYDKQLRQSGYKRP